MMFYGWKWAKGRHHPWHVNNKLCKLPIIPAIEAEAMERDDDDDNHNSNDISSSHAYHKFNRKVNLPFVIYSWKRQ